MLVGEIVRGWCQQPAGTFTWRHGTAEMGGGGVCVKVGDQHTHSVLAGQVRVGAVCMGGLAWW